jgi:hypothetical protein
MVQDRKMSSRLLNPGPLTLRRAVRWAIGLFPVVLLGLIAALWLQSQLAAWAHWKVGLALLIALEIAYGISMSAAGLGTLLFGVLIVLRRRGGRVAPSLTRGFLLCGSVLLAALVAEAACAAWRFGTERHSSKPGVGLRTDSLVVSEMRIRRPAFDVSLPTAFDDPPGDRDIDLVVLGDSCAAGIPFDRWLSLGRILKWKLAEAIPERPIRLNVLASIGDTLKSQHGLLASLRRRPEILIVYCGNAQFTMTLPDSREIAYYFDERLPAPGDVILDWIEGSSPVCGFLHENQERCRTHLPPAAHRSKLIDEPVYTQIEYVTLLVEFRRRLEAIVSFADGIGALPILVAPGSNDAGFEPNRSFLPANTPRGERAALAREFHDARRTEGTDPGRAMGRYRALLARQPGFAEAHYRLAKLLEGRGEWEEAFRHYIAARDQDGFPVRLLTAFQDVYHEVAARHGCILIDMQSYFHLIGRHGLLDDELFQDAMHVSLRGHIALAQAVLQALYARRAFGLPADSTIPFIDPSECAAHFNLKPADWRFVCHWGIMFADMTGRWRNDPSRRELRRALYANAADRIAAGEAPESLGLPNIGVPAPIPVDLSARAAPDAGRKAPFRSKATPHR